MGRIAGVAIEAKGEPGHGLQSDVPDDPAHHDLLAGTYQRREKAEPQERDVACAVDGDANIVKPERPRVSG
jgi:hypothetical protein